MTNISKALLPLIFALSANAGDSNYNLLLRETRALETLAAGYTPVTADASTYGLQRRITGAVEYLATNGMSGTVTATNAVANINGFATNLTLKGTLTFGDTAYTLPATDGSSGQALATQGDGTLGWVDSESRLTDELYFAITNKTDLLLHDTFSDDHSGVSTFPVDDFGQDWVLRGPGGEASSTNIYTESGRMKWVKRTSNYQADYAVSYCAAPIRGIKTTIIWEDGGGSAANDGHPVIVITDTITPSCIKNLIHCQIFQDKVWIDAWKDGAHTNKVEGLWTAPANGTPVEVYMTVDSDTGTATCYIDGVQIVQCTHQWITDVAVNGKYFFIEFYADLAGTPANVPTYDEVSVYGIKYQPYKVPLTALGAVTPATNTVPYFTGDATADTFEITTFGMSLLDDAAATNVRTTLGLPATTSRGDMIARGSSSDQAISPGARTYGSTPRWNGTDTVFSEPNKSWHLHEEFVYQMNASYGMPFIMLNSGGTVSPAWSTYVNSTNFGLVQIKSDSVGDCPVVRLSSQNTFGGATWYIRTRVLTPAAVSDDTDNYELRVGYSNTYNSTNVTDGVYLLYNHAVSSYWQLRCVENSSVTTSSSTAVTCAAATWYTIELLVDAACNVTAWINGTQVATNADSNVPSGSRLVFMLWQNVRHAGTADREMVVDYADIHVEFANAR